MGCSQVLCLGSLSRHIRICLATSRRGAGRRTWLAHSTQPSLTDALLWALSRLDLRTSTPHDPLRGPDVWDNNGGSVRVSNIRGIQKSVGFFNLRAWKFEAKKTQLNHWPRHSPLTDSPFSEGNNEEYEFPVYVSSQTVMICGGRGMNARRARRSKSGRFLSYESKEWR